MPFGRNVRAAAIFYSRMKLTAGHCACCPDFGREIPQFAYLPNRLGQRQGR